MNIGDNIRLIRRTRNMTQEELAAMLGYTKSFLSLVESGSRSLSEEDLVRVSDALNISMEELKSTVSVHFRSNASQSLDTERISRDFLSYARTLGKKKN